VKDVHTRFAYFPRLWVTLSKAVCLMAVLVQANSTFFGVWFLGGEIISIMLEVQYLLVF
jgi:hypothetical protein